MQASLRARLNGVVKRSAGVHEIHPLQLDLELAPAAAERVTISAGKKAY
jgi:hypothetical protein